MVIITLVITQALNKPTTLHAELCLWCEISAALMSGWQSAFFLSNPSFVIQVEQESLVI